jgi:hypothetical protein
MLEFEPVDKAVAVLERFAGHPDEGVRESVARVARALIEEPDGCGRERVRLESLAQAWRAKPQEKPLPPAATLW